MHMKDNFILPLIIQYEIMLYNRKEILNVEYKEDA